MRYCSVKCCDVNDFSGTMIHKFKKEWRDLNCWKGYFKTIVWFEVYIYIPRVLHIQIKPYCLTFGIESVESTIPSVQHVHCQSIYCFIYGCKSLIFQNNCLIWGLHNVDIPRVMHKQIKPYCLTFGIESVESTIPSV